MNRRSVRAPVLALSIVLMVGCATTQATRSTTPAPEPEQTFAAPTSLWEHDIAPAPAPIIAAPQMDWTSVAGDASDAALSLAELPAECTVTREGALRSVACPGWDVVVEVRDETPGALDVDGLTSDTLQWFQARGAKAVMLGSPACNVGGLDAPCSFIEANSEFGLIGTGYVAIADDGDRAFSLRCLYGSGGRDQLLTDPACRELLRVTVQ